MLRAMSRTYRDPVDLIWLGTAARLGWRVVRSHEVYAAWDGRDTLTIGDERDFDPDDCLAQMIFHEICHALVEGPDALAQVDWGLCNYDDGDVLREYACHRVQAALADPYGLRAVLAPTTVYRPYFEALGADPLAGDDGAVAPARAGYARGTEGPWAAVIAEALAATAAVGRAAAAYAPAQSLWSQVGSR